MIEKLNDINFNKVLLLDKSESIENYSFNRYLSLNKKHPIIGYCTLCEHKQCHVSPSETDYKLSNISNGASSYDFFQATNSTNIDFSNWHDEGVLFLMESPGRDQPFYKNLKYDGINKRPTEQWYWVHETKSVYKNFEKFKGMTYGSLINNVLFTFKLKNTYLTNLVKCGLNDSKAKFKGLKDYDRNCLKTCFENVLSEEMNIVKPKVVFTFGSEVYKKFNWLIKNKGFDFIIVSLPHPAGRQRGFKDNYYRHLYFHLILEGLFKAGIVSVNEAQELLSLFLQES